MVYNSKTNFTFETDLSFERKGTSYRIIITDNLGNFGSYKMVFHNFDYLTLSVLPGFKTNEKIKYFLNAGLNFGINVNNGKYFSGKNSLKIFDIAVALKTGIQHDISKKVILNIFVQDNVTILNNLAYTMLNGVMHNSFLVGLGAYYRFSL